MSDKAQLSQHGRVCAEYVWIGGNGLDLRCKTKILEAVPESVADLPIWNYDGSSTDQAPGHNSEVLIKPVAIFKDPFRGSSNIIVLCDTHRPLDDGGLAPLVVTPGESSLGDNTRAAALKIFQSPSVAEQEVWYGIEQEYTLFNADGITPLGWPKGGFPAPQGQYYCSAGAENAFGRDVAEAHLAACLHAGVQVSGINAEVMPGQWEYQVGPCLGIDAGDHLIISRYLLMRVCEKLNVVVSFHPKPIRGDWNGAGCHTNFSTKAMRSKDTVHAYTPKKGPFAGKALEGALALMVETLEERMGPKAQEHILLYGAENEQRLTGKHETASINDWSYGVADRGASVRIPRDTYHRGYGYLEDRRPASNMDPYIVTSKIAETCLL